MYIKLDEERYLTVTQHEPLYKGENLSSKLIFLLPKKFGELETECCTIFLSFVRADGLPDISILEKTDSYNENYSQYAIPVDCKLTEASGDVILWLQAHCEVDGKEAIAKSGECVLHVEKTRDECGLASDAIYTAIHQIRDELRGKADNLSYDDEARRLCLTSEGAEIGDSVTVPGDSYVSEDGDLPWSSITSTEAGSATGSVASWEQM